jgi:5-methylcytosine-specific restriction endonuclease McrA
MSDSFSREDKELMRRAQFNRCAKCGKLLGTDAQGHAIFRSHEYWLNGQLLCPECHKKTRSYGRQGRRPGDPLYPLMD